MCRPDPKVAPMQQKAHPFIAEGAPGQSAQCLDPQAQTTAGDHLSGMRGGHGDHPDEDTETLCQADRLPHMNE